LNTFDATYFGCKFRPPFLVIHVLIISSW